MDVPTPIEGSPTQRTRRPVPPSLKVGVPIGAIGSLALVAIGWAWNTDKAQALDHQRLETVQTSHEALKADVKGDLKEIRQKLDDIRDLVRDQQRDPYVRAPHTITP